jgi:hypothetical protein
MNISPNAEHQQMDSLNTRIRTLEQELESLRNLKRQKLSDDALEKAHKELEVINQHTELINKWTYKLRNLHDTFQRDLIKDLGKQMLTNYEGLVKSEDSFFKELSLDLKNKGLDETSAKLILHKIPFKISRNYSFVIYNITENEDIPYDARWLVYNGTLLPDLNRELRSFIEVELSRESSE